MRYVPYNTRRSTSVLLFNAARTQLTGNSVNVATLSDAHISSGTEELNVNADDISATSRKVEAPRAAKAQPQSALPG